MSLNWDLSSIVLKIRLVLITFEKKAIELNIIFIKYNKDTNYKNNLLLLMFTLIVWLR
jgi:hypothetical protein